MKKVKFHFFLTLIILIFTFLLATAKAQAQSVCDNLSVTVDGRTAHLVINCSRFPSWAAAKLWITDSSRQIVTNIDPVIIDGLANGPIERNITIPEAGRYLAVLTEHPHGAPPNAGVIIVSNEFSILSTAPTLPPLSCGDRCTGYTDMRCPTSCSCELDRSKNDFFCSLSPPTDRVSCLSKDGKAGVNTALGCIPTEDLNAFSGWILRNLIFVASGIAFILMAIGALQILTSAGNPEKMKAGSELITSALSGLIFIILSVFLLKLIGVDILRIPGFGS